MDEQEPASGGAPAFPLDKLAHAYRRIRGEMAKVQQDYDTQMEDLKSQHQKLKNAMKDILLATGGSSIRTNEGTVTLTTKTTYNTQDWDSFRKFVVQEDAVDLLQARIHQTNMTQWLEQNPGKVPPGLNAFTEYDISVRKPTT